VFVGDLQALTFLLLFVLVFMRYWREPTIDRAGLMGACFAASVAFRYPNVLLALPFCMALVAGRRVVLKHALVAGAAAVPFAAAVLLFNQLVYGDPMTTGFHLGKELIDETVNFSKESFFKRRPEVLWRYLKMYALVPVVALPVAASLGSAALVAFRKDGRGDTRMLAFVSLGLFAILLAYYGQQDAWGYASAQLNASVLRYLLPGFALLMVFGAGVLAQMAQRWGWGLYLVPAAFVAVTVWQVQTAPGGVGEVQSVIDRSAEVQRQVVAATEPDAVIASRIMDKVLFPQRQTMTLTFAMQNEEPLDKGNSETWEFVAPPGRFAAIAVQMDARGIPFYLLRDAHLGDIQQYQDALMFAGYQLVRVEDVTAASLLKVVPRES
jgi:hypothetical protein